MSSVPLKNARLVALAAAWVFSVVAACIGLNALVRSNQQQSALKAKVTPPTVVNIDVSQITNVGIVATTINILIGVLTFNYFAITLLPRFHALSNRTLKIQGASLAFCALWVFACMVPFMIFFYNRHAAVTAFVGTVQLPDALIKSLEAKSGSTSVYRKLWYLRLLAIFPWFAIVATLAASTVLFKASSAVGSAPPSAPAQKAAETSQIDSEKESISHNEKV